MNFTCERPYAFYGLLLIIPALIITFFQYFTKKRQAKNLTL